MSKLAVVLVALASAVLFVSIAEASKMPVPIYGSRRVNLREPISAERVDIYTRSSTHRANLELQLSTRKIKVNPLKTQRVNIYTHASTHRVYIQKDFNDGVLGQWPTYE